MKTVLEQIAQLELEIANLKKQLELKDFFVSCKWNVEDVKKCGRDRFDRELSDHDAAFVLERVLDNFDANDGINWDAITREIEKL